MILEVKLLITGPSVSLWSPDVFLFRLLQSKKAAVKKHYVDQMDAVKKIFGTQYFLEAEECVI